METDLVVVGAGGFAREVVNLVLDHNEAGRHAYRLLGCVADPAPDPALLDRLGVAYLGHPSALRELAGSDFVVAIGDLGVRRRLFDQAAQAGLRPTMLVHPSAVLGRDLELGAGSLVMAGSVVTSNIRIGDGTVVNQCVSIGHDTVIGAFSTVSPNASISGRCWIGERVDIGTGAVVLPDIRIGDGAVVGAGAVVTRDVAPGATVVGVPARPR